MPRRIDNHPILGSNPRGARVTISVDGEEICALAGEPVAAALLANGIRSIRTMPESGTVRGVFTGSGRSIEELGVVNGESNVPLMHTPVEDGMTIQLQLGLGEWTDEG